MRNVKVKFVIDLGENLVAEFVTTTKLKRGGRRFTLPDLPPVLVGLIPKNVGGTFGNVDWCEDRQELIIDCNEWFEVPDELKAKLRDELKAESRVN